MTNNLDSKRRPTYKIPIIVGLVALFILVSFFSLYLSSPLQLMMLVLPIVILLGAFLPNIRERSWREVWMHIKKYSNPVGIGVTLFVLGTGLETYFLLAPCWGAECAGVFFVVLVFAFPVALIGSIVFATALSLREKKRQVRVRWVSKFFLGLVLLVIVAFLLLVIRGLAQRDLLF